MKTISKNDLVKLLESTTTEELTIISRSEAKMNKTNNPFYHKEGRSWVADHLVEKEAESTYDFGGSYEKRVNEALVADGSTATFESEGLKWGSWLVKGKVIEHNGKLYVRCYVKNGVATRYSYLVDGRPATDSELENIKEYSPEHKESAKQSEAGLLVGKQIIPNNVDFDNIVSISFDGEDYEIS